VVTNKCKCLLCKTLNMQVCEQHSNNKRTKADQLLSTKDAQGLFPQ
jgi:hypothetical protein